MPTFKEQLAVAPQTLGVAGRFLPLLGKSDNPIEFLFACREGEFDRAFDTIDQSDEAIHEEVTAIREAATEVTTDNPDLAEELHKETHE